MTYDQEGAEYQQMLLHESGVEALEKYIEDIKDMRSLPITPSPPIYKSIYSGKYFTELEVAEDINRMIVMSPDCAHYMFSQLSSRCPLKHEYDSPALVKGVIGALEGITSMDSKAMMLGDGMPPQTSDYPLAENTNIPNGFRSYAHKYGHEGTPGVKERRKKRKLERQNRKKNRK